MALINCAECARDISDQAAVCPGCGAPVPRAAAPVLKGPDAAQVAAAVITIAAVLGGLFWLVWADNQPDPRLLKCEAAIKATLRSPSSYKWVSGSADGVIEYDAQNGFGAVIRGSGSCSFDAAGKAAWFEYSSLAP